MFGTRFAPSKLATLGLGTLTCVNAVALLACDASPGLFPRGAHGWLAATPLVTIAVAYLAYQVTRGASIHEWVKAGLLAAAFLSWAANQVCPDPQQAALLNDVAIAAFVLDVVLAMAGWPAPRPSRGLAGERMVIDPIR